MIFGETTVLYSDNQLKLLEQSDEAFNIKPNGSDNVLKCRVFSFGYIPGV
jgi:hypothetical protein